MNVALVFLLCGLCFAKPTTGKLRFPSIYLLRFIYLSFLLLLISNLHSSYLNIILL